MKNSLESLFTRGISVGSKFLLVGYLAKALNLDDYGSYQLISYFVLISTTVFGLEFYNLTNRAIAKTERKSKIYNQHLSFFLSTSPILILVQIALFLLIFPRELISLVNIILVLIIGLCDYFSQEVYRYLMINRSFRKGNLQLIYKSLLFVIFVVVYDQMVKELTFLAVLWIMLASYLILFLLAYKTFSTTLHVFKRDVVQRMKKPRLIKSLNAVLPFVVLIVFLKGIEFSDKFIIGKQLGLQDIGIYSFVFQVASSINIFIVSGFYIIYLPQLIQTYESNTLRFKVEYKNFAMLTCISSIVLAIIITAISPFVFQLIGKSVFLQHMNLLKLLFIGFILNNMSLVPHIFLYILEDEKVIMTIMAIAFVLNLGLNVTLVPRYGIDGAAYSFIATYSLVFLLKAVRAYIKWKKAKG